MFKKNSKSVLIIGIILDLIIVTTALYGASTRGDSVTAKIFWNGALILSGMLLGLDVRDLVDKQFEE